MTANDNKQNVKRLENRYFYNFQPQIFKSIRVDIEKLLLVVVFFENLYEIHKFSLLFYLMINENQRKYFKEI